MKKPRNPAKATPKSGEHPEAKKHVSAGVPDARSSKALEGEQRDARTANDKDGNEEQQARSGAKKTSR